MVGWILGIEIFYGIKFSGNDDFFFGEGFGSICGSSVATAATMAQVALPELRRAGYSGGLSVATLAAGGATASISPRTVS